MNRIALASALGAFLFFPACSESEATTVTGVYEMDADATAAAMATAMKITDEAAIAGLKATMKGSTELKADMTYIVDGGEGVPQRKGTWTIKDGALTFTQTHNGDKEEADSATGTLKDGKLAVIFSKKGPTGEAMEISAHFTKKK